MTRIFRHPEENTNFIEEIDPQIPFFLFLRGEIF